VVYRLAEGKAVVTPVTIGAANMTDTVILSGLDGDDRVVVGPYSVLEDIAHEDAVIDEREAAAKRAEAERDAEDVTGTGSGTEPGGGENDADDAPTEPTGSGSGSSAADADADAEVGPDETTEG